MSASLSYLDDSGPEVMNTDRSRLQFGIHHRNDLRYPEFQRALDGRVQQFTVEMMNTYADGPHAEFKFNLEARDSFSVSGPHPAKFVGAASIAMYQNNRHKLAHERTEDKIPGVCLIRLRDYGKLSPNADVGFGFELRTKGLKLRDFVRVITGEHWAIKSNTLRGNMANFEFRRNPFVGYYDGSRDWIAQVFGRFVALKWVRWERIDQIIPRYMGTRERPWEAHEALFRRLDGDPHKEICWATAEFHDIITKDYTQPNEPTENRPTSSVYYIDLPLRAGWFEDDRVKRIFVDPSNMGAGVLLDYDWSGLPAYPRQ